MNATKMRAVQLRDLSGNDLLCTKDSRSKWLQVCNPLIEMRITHPDSPDRFSAEFPEQQPRRSVSMFCQCRTDREWPHSNNTHTNDCGCALNLDDRCVTNGRDKPPSCGRPYVHMPHSRPKRP